MQDIHVVQHSVLLFPSFPPFMSSSKLLCTTLRCDSISTATISQYDTVSYSGSACILDSCEFIDLKCDLRSKCWFPRFERLCIYPTPRQMGRSSAFMTKLKAQTGRSTMPIDDLVPNRPSFHLFGNLSCRLYNI